MAAQAAVELTGQVAEDDAMFGRRRGVRDDRATDKFITPGVTELGLVGPQERIGVEERRCCVPLCPCRDAITARADLP